MSREAERFKKESQGAKLAIKAIFSDRKTGDASSWASQPRRLGLNKMALEDKKPESRAQKKVYSRVLLGRKDRRTLENASVLTGLEAQSPLAVPCSGCSGHFPAGSVSSDSSFLVDTGSAFPICVFCSQCKEYSIRSSKNLAS